jgi:hypothetical protein
VNILLSSVTAVFGAFCVWLTVRFVNRRERWAKWALILAVGLPVVYVASFGPACWVSSHTEVGQTAVSWIFRPLGKLCADYSFAVESPSPGVHSEWLDWYSTVFAPDGWAWQYTFDIGSDGRIVVDDRLEIVRQTRWAPETIGFL